MPMLLVARSAPEFPQTRPQNGMRRFLLLLAIFLVLDAGKLAQRKCKRSREIMGMVASSRLSWPQMLGVEVYSS